MEGTEATAPGITILLATNSSSGQSAKRRKSQVYFFPLPLLPTTAADAARCSPGGQPLFCKFYSLPPSLLRCLRRRRQPSFIFPPLFPPLAALRERRSAARVSWSVYSPTLLSLSLVLCQKQKLRRRNREEKKKRERYFAAGNFCTISNRRRKRSRKERHAVSATTKIPQKL